MMKRPYSSSGPSQVIRDHWTMMTPATLYNVMVEWETGEITEKPLCIIAADDPVTCAAHAKKFKNIARNQKSLTRAINQTKVRQVRRVATYNFGYQSQKTTNMP